jgi:hypothetical protein
MFTTPFISVRSLFFDDRILTAFAAPCQRCSSDRHANQARMRREKKVYYVMDL